MATNTPVQLSEMNVYLKLAGESLVVRYKVLFMVRSYIYKIVLNSS